MASLLALLYVDGMSSALQDALDKRIEAYSNKVYDAHEKRHKKTLDAMYEARKAINKSHTQVRAAKLRIAGKYGYVRPPRRSRIRRRRATESDE